MMKNFVIAALLTALSASGQKNTASDHAVLSGDIKNKMDSGIIVMNSDYQPIDTLAVSAAGHFKEALRIAPGFYIIQHKEASARVYMEPGSDLNLAFDARDLKKSLKFSGKGEAANSYFSKKNSSQWGMIEDLKKRYELNETDFKSMAAKAKASKDSLLLSRRDLAGSFIDKEKRNINYEYIIELIKYADDRAYYTGKEELKPGEGFLPDLKGFDYDNEEDFSYSNSYRNIVSAHYRKQGKELAEREKSDNYSLSYVKILSGVNNQDIKNKLLYSHARNAISNAWDLDAYYSIFISSSTDRNNNKEISAIYQKLLPLSKGRQSPKFTAYDSFDGGKVSLDDLKGKYVYIDIWATWCGPCKTEIPHLSRLEEDYKGRNIQFLSISIDKRSDISKWKKMITEKKMGGIQVIADNAAESAFVKDYYVMGIPRFILIDPQGKIVTSNAPRPSEARLKALLDKLDI